MTNYHNYNYIFFKYKTIDLQLNEIHSTTYKCVYFIADKLFKYQRNLPKQYGPINQIHGLNVRMVNLTEPADIEVIIEEI